MIEYRPANDLADGRVAYWLKIIERYGPSAGRVVEVGCGSGVLLGELKDRGYECVGVEPDERTAEWTRRSIDVDVRAGLFPGIKLPSCDLFMAFDVIEHSIDPEAFMMEVAQLLNPGGIAIIQTPIERYDYQPPFGDMFDAVFDNLEHLYIFNMESVRRLSEITGMRIIGEADWRLAHEIIIIEAQLCYE
jgi:2-polyprenyl-3-methyl-5-hydroxy-6-metoxy-1,4-benzoquinol methylase